MEKKRKWPVAMIGVVVFVLAAVLAGAVFAQTATPEAQTPSTDSSIPFGGPMLRGFGLHHGDGFGRDSDRDQYLADALGITVEELQAARDRAFAAAVAEAVAAGQITQAQADEMLAMHALRSYLDKEAIIAEALGMSVEELETALSSGQTLVDLLAAQGLDQATFQANVQAAYEAAIARAVADGVITQEQADQILSNMPGFGLFGWGHGGHGHGRGGFRGGRGGFFGDGGVPSVPDSAAPTDTGLDA